MADKIDPATGKALPKGVYLRKPGQYQARKLIDGKRVIQTFATAALARRWLGEKTAEKHLGLFREPTQADTMTIRELLERYRDERMANRKADREGHLPPILDDAIAGVSLGKWSAADVRGFRDRMLATGFSGGTVVKRLTILASAVNHAISEWDVKTVNYASGRVVKRPAGADKKRDRRLAGAGEDDGGNDIQAGEYERLLVAMSRSSVADDIWFARWQIEQGTRRGEAISLRWCDVDIERRVITLYQTKMMYKSTVQGPERRPLMPGARRLLLEKLSQYEKPPRASDLIFDVGNEDALSMRFTRNCRRAELTNLRLHDLRHEATSRLAKLFTNPLDLCRVTGHRDLKSLNRYYQPVIEDLALAAEAQERLLGIAYDDEGM
ncbi:site-specific integrase [Gluconacetobacter tumulicola]|uniref:Site-specific integrase n=1 Tax=Gluconacetobacter tumulicola TaxID=1017177 RepID=A0A7W4JF48_9PROT|nr:site-specific integrase [Gluconacetobacter tumulicola]MBB2180136.1 site-specific integrase [Gluconacetobacter tumulicola]